MDSLKQYPLPVENGAGLVSLVARRTLLATFCGMALYAASLASAQTIPLNDRVRIEVRVQSRQDRKDIAQSTADTVTQHETLNIALSGKAKSPETRMGTWTVYGRSFKGNDIVVIESGEFKVDFSGGVQKIESKQVSTTYTPMHSVVSKSRGKKTSAKVYVAPVDSAVRISTQQTGEAAV